MKKLCVICDEKVPSGAFEKHKKTHTDSDIKNLKFSNDMKDACKTLCMLCDKAFILTRMRTHTKEKHFLQISEYRKRFNLSSFQIIEKVFHSCGICDEVLLLDSDLIGSHLHNHEGISHSSYNNKFMKTMKNKVDVKKEMHVEETEPKTAKEEEEKVEEAKEEEIDICFCEEKSGGSTVKCSGETCVVGYFHLSCVGLDNYPSENWYCNECVDTTDMDTEDKDDDITATAADTPAIITDNNNCEECEIKFSTKLVLLKHYSLTHYTLYLSALVREFFASSEVCLKCEQGQDSYTSPALQLIHIGQSHADFSKLVKNSSET